jgi:hypothetical protein
MEAADFLLKYSQRCTNPCYIFYGVNVLNLISITGNPISGFGVVGSTVNHLINFDLKLFTTPSSESLN